MKNNRTPIKNEAIIVFGISLGAAFGAATGSIFESISIPVGISSGIIIGLLIASFFGKKIVQMFGNPDKKDSNE
ncbi:hypothetical protein APF79_11315 [bacterium BRH_c32]|nr:MAG: hypothetical protein APF79_11315 [bacterium BRH_c32]